MGTQRRVAVLGIGGVGAAAARFLAEAGHCVVGFEQFQLDHDRGSSYGGSRIIRKVYPDPLYAELMQSAYPLWMELQARRQEELFLRCGGFFFGPGGPGEMADTEKALQQVGVPYDHLDREQAARRFPQFVLREDEYGIFEPDCGLLRASRCVRASAELATAAGADLRFNCPVERVEVGEDHGARILADGEWHRFDSAVVSAGPWTAPLLKPWVDLPLEVTRQQYAHFTVTGNRGDFSPTHFPVWIDQEELIYGFPENSDAPGAKVANHNRGVLHDPSSDDREPRDVDDEVLRAYLKRRIPRLQDPITIRKVCLYTMTPDSDFVVDRLPGAERVVFIGGLSGHGFKFTLLLGQIASRLADDREAGYPLDRFSIRRFSVA